ncbi:MAG: response regulator [Faecalibacterium sp.]
MRIIYVDDEKNAIKNFDFYIQQYPYVTERTYFSRAQEALAFAKEHAFDIAFLDIQMPDMDGFVLSRTLKELQPEIEVIYVTAFNDYHQEAYSHGGRAYLLKPFQQSDLDEVFTFLSKITSAPVVESSISTPPPVKPPIFIQTFGNFDLWVNGRPVVFKTAKAKELLAVLVNHRGGVVSNIEIFNFLWPDKIYSKSTATYVRKVVQSLKVQLAAIGCSDIVTFSRNAFYINADAFVCDYYTVTAGETTYLASYNGYYMAQYTWADESIYIIEQNIKALTAHQAQKGAAKAAPPL